MSDENITYYGRIDGDIPRLGLEYFMLDDQIKKIINTRIKLFEKSLEKTLAVYKSRALVELKSVQKEMKIIKEMIKKIPADETKKVRKNDKNAKDAKEMADIKKSLQEKGFLKNEE